MIRLRVLSERGVREFLQYIRDLRDNPRLSPPDLNVEPYSVEFHSVEIDENKNFSTRMEMGKYLYSTFLRGGIAREKVIGEKGLWTWLAFLWFDRLCPDNKQIKGHERYICYSDYRHYYRHLVGETYTIYELHREENSKLFLECPLHIHNDFMEQLASRQEIVNNLNLIEVAHRLYWNAGANKPKRGAQSKENLGNLRRFTRVVEQLKLTYDLHKDSMTADEILNLLPREFDQWKTAGE